MDKIKNTRWLIVDITIICFLLSLILLGGLDESDSYYGAAFFFAIGIFLFTSNKLKDQLYLSKALSWIAENIFKPKTTFNHIISGALFIFVGVAVILSGPLNSSEKEFYENLVQTSEFWIPVILVLLFNILVGVYTARGTKQKKGVNRSR